MRYYLAYFAILATVALAYVLYHRSERYRVAGLALLSMTMAGMAAFLFRYGEPRTYLNDFFKAYYPAGRIVHEDPGTLYDPVPLDFVNVPIVGYAFTPFTWLSRDAARDVVTALSAVVVVAAFVLLVRLAKLNSRQAWGLAALFVISGPLFNSLREGNATHFVLLALVVVLAFAQARRDLEAGALLALCVVMKPPLVLLLLPFMLAGRWRAVGAFAGVGAVVAVASLAIFGLDLHITWYERVVEPFQRHPIGAYNVQSVDGFVARLLEGRRHTTDWLPIEDISSAFVPLRLVVVAALLGATVWAWWPARGARFADTLVLDVSILLVLSMVLGPISWTHYYAQALIPLAFIAGGVIRIPGEPIWRLLLGASVLLMSPIAVLAEVENGPLDALVARVFISHYFYGGVLLLAVLLESRRRIALPASATAAAPT